MIAFEDIDNRLESLGLDRAWLAEITGRSPGSIRSALAPNADPSKRSSLIQKALSDAIEAEEANRASAREKEGQRESVPPGYSALFLNDEELDLVDKASRLVEAPSLAAFCHDIIQGEARRIIAENAAKASIVSFPTKDRGAHLMAAAGSPINAEMIESHGGGDTVKIRISGLSMDPLFSDGEIVTGLLKHACRSSEWKRGYVYLVSYEGGLTVKRYNTRLATPEEIEAGISYVSPRDHKAKVRVLESENPAFPEIVIKGDVDWIAWIDTKASPSESQ